MVTVASGARTAANRTGPGLMPLGHPLPRSIGTPVPSPRTCTGRRHALRSSSRMPVLIARPGIPSPTPHNTPLLQLRARDATVSHSQVSPKKPNMGDRGCPPNTAMKATQHGEELPECHGD